MKRFLYFLDELDGCYVLEELTVVSCPFRGIIIMILKVKRNPFSRSKRLGFSIQTHLYIFNFIRDYFLFSHLHLHIREKKLVT